MKTATEITDLLADEAARSLDRVKSDAKNYKRKLESLIRAAKDAMEQCDLLVDDKPFSLSTDWVESHARTASEMLANINGGLAIYRELNGLHKHVSK